MKEMATEMNEVILNSEFLKKLMNKIKSGKTSREKPFNNGFESKF